MTTLIAFTLLTAAPAANIDDYVQPNLKDASFQAKVAYSNQVELRKINKDFGSSYSFETVNIKAKEPFMLRLDSIVEDTSISYVVNGTRAVYIVPRMHIRKGVDLSKSPGRRQTFLDFGLLTPSLFRTFLDATFVRMDRKTGDAVFDLSYGGQEGMSSGERDDSRHRIWIDPDKKIVTRREWYNQKGKQIATFLYEKPVKENGIWMPTQLTVRNMDDKVAGVTKYAAFKVNTGLTSDDFPTK